MSGNMLSPARAGLPGLVRYHLQPSASESKRLLSVMVGRYGLRGASEVMGQSVVTVKRWAAGENLCSCAVRRCIWLHYVLLFEPERVQTLFDLATWGRFRVVNPADSDKETD